MPSTEEKGSRLGFGAGAALGVAFVALVAAGWLLAGRGSNEADPEPASTTAANPAAGLAADGASPHSGAELEIGSDPEISRLRGELEASPDRLELRKRLALELLRRAQYYAAFDEAGRILAQSPEDIDGLFVTAAIRVRMGQSNRALPLLERVLAQAPEHVPALTAKGQALLKTGHTEPAVAVWKRALALSGGHNVQVEELLASVPSGTGSPHPTVGE